MNEYEVKAFVRQRDKNKCRDCGMPEEDHQKEYGKSLEVHRLIPRMMYVADWCVLLCRKCHAAKPKTVQTAFWSEATESGIEFFCLNLYDEQQRKVYETMTTIAQEENILLIDLMTRILGNYIERMAVDNYVI